MRASCVLPREARRGNNDLPDELRSLAYDVRRIGCAYRTDPESVAIEKDEVVKRLVGLARRLEASL